MGKRVRGTILTVFISNMPFKNTLSQLHYSFFYRYEKKRIIKIFITFFSIIGAIWTFIEFSDWLLTGSEFPDLIRQFILQNLKWEFLLLTAISLYVNRLRIRKQRKFANTDLTVIVEFCDIFQQEGAIVIPVNDTFDNDTSNGLVNPNTLHGQFLEKFYRNNIPALNNQISTSLGGYGIVPLETNQNLKGNKNRFEIGTTCPVKSHNKYFYLSALTYMKDTGNVDMQPEYIYDFLSKLWNFIPQHGDYHDVVNIPVIGTGLNRLPANYTNQFIVSEIVNSFFVTSKVQTFCKTLRVCLYPKNFKFYNFDDIEILFCHIDSYLNR
jgi:hypothetical protein